MPDCVLAIDQGTTSTRAVLFDADCRPLAIAQQEFPQSFPASGWVEHDPEAIWRSVVETCRAAMAKAGLSSASVAAIGIANQRETVVIWDRATGAPIHNAIVWQDRRTADVCSGLREAGHETAVSLQTGLIIDPYFSATKIAWILDHVEGARARAERGELAFGTVDSFLVWRLTGGAVHTTDATNAARTLLFDIHTGVWDDTLLALFRVPREILPAVRDCASHFGDTAPEIFGSAIEIRGIAGDQQAATIGQACFRPGMVKATFGTGCFALLNTGPRAVSSQHRLLTTIASQIDGRRDYALEGSIFVAGAAVQWLRDGLGMIATAADSSALAAKADNAQRLYLVPAFTGLGAPHWDADARGALYGLTRATGPAEIARAALESVCYQTRDLIEAMRGDWRATKDEIAVLRVDGGMVASDWTMQCLADTLDLEVHRPDVLETTALGAAYLAGMAIGLYPGPEEFAGRWRLERRFTPALDTETREANYAGWRDAVARTLTRHGS